MSDPIASTDDPQSWLDAAETYKVGGEEFIDDGPLPFEIASGDEDFSLADYVEPDAPIDKSVDKLANVTEKVSGDASNVLAEVAPDAGKYANLPNQGKFMGKGFFTETTGGVEGAGGAGAQFIKAIQMAKDAGTLGQGGALANMGITGGGAGGGGALSGLLTNPAGLLAGMTPFGWAMMGLSVLSMLNEKFDWF